MHFFSSDEMDNSSTLPDEIMKKQINPNDFEGIADPSSNENSVTVKQGLRTFTKNICYNLDEKRLFREIGILSQLHHRAILPFIGFSISQSPGEPSVIITGRATNGNLKTIIEKEFSGHKPKEWNITKKWICLYGIAKGMEYCHARSIFHRAIQPENIQLDGNFEPKISNFDLAKKAETDQNLRSQMADVNSIYSAPEYLEDAPYDSKIDVYSYGVLLFFVFSGKTPFASVTINDYITRIKNGVRDTASIETSWPDCIRQLIECCWDSNIYRRPTFADIAQVLIQPKNFPPGADVQSIEDYARQIESYSECEESFPRYSEDQIRQFFATQASTQSVIWLQNGTVTTKPLEIDTIEKKRIGSGTSGVVYQFEHQGNTYALKQILLNNNDSFTFTRLIREVSIMSQLDHPAITHLFGFKFPQEDKNDAFLILEYMPRNLLTHVNIENLVLYLDSQPPNSIPIHEGIKTDLEKLYNMPYSPLKKIKNDAKALPKDRPPWDITQKAIVLYGIAAAMEYCHSHEILHRDLKPENILLDANSEPHICDFGHGKVIQDLTDGASISMGTPCYTSPEWFQEKKCYYPADVYSFGALAFFVFAGRHIYQFEDISQLVFINKIRNGGRDTIPDYVPSKFKELIENCWAPSESSRPTFSAIVKRLRTENNSIPGFDTQRFDAYVQKLDQYQRQPRIAGIDSLISKLLDSSKSESNDALISAGIEYQRNKEYPKAIHQFQCAMQNGDARGHYYYAKLLSKGQGVKRSIPLAIESYQTVLKLNTNIRNGALIDLGQIHEDLNDFFQAQKFYSEAMQAHSQYAKTLYARLLAYGKGIEASPKRAIQLLQESARNPEEDNGFSLAFLGQLCLDGIYKPKNGETAFQYFTRAAQYGCPQAFTGLGLCYLNGCDVNKDPTKAIVNFMKGVAKDEVNSSIHLARIYEEGIGVRPDRRLAISHLQKASRMGSSQADFELGKLYLKHKDDKEGLRSLQVASENGNQDATFELGMYYKNAAAAEHDPKSKQQSFDKAATYFLSLANENHTKGMREYGILHLKQLIQANSFNEAVKFLKLAADDGDDIAQLNLGILYYNHNDKMNLSDDESMQKARYYFDLAAQQGNEQAAERLENFD